VNGRAVRRVDAERQLRAWGEALRVEVSILRAPGIYAADRLPLDRIKRGTPALVA
jgi:nucleoside-diphosphate-sugar epimerase